MSYGCGFAAKLVSDMVQKDYAKPIHSNSLLKFVWEAPATSRGNRANAEFHPEVHRKARPSGKGGPRRKAVHGAVQVRSECHFQRRSEEKCHAGGTFGPSSALSEGSVRLNDGSSQPIYTEKTECQGLL